MTICGSHIFSVHFLLIWRERGGFWRLWLESYPKEYGRCVHEGDADYEEELYYANEMGERRSPCTYGGIYCDIMLHYLL